MGTAWHKVESKLVNISTAEADENDLVAFNNL